MVFRDFSRDVNSAYAELLVPLFGEGNARAGLQSLQVNAAIRYDDYSDVGDTTNPKFGLTCGRCRSWQFAGSWGTSFRAPLISQIYGNSNNLFAQSYQNPAGGAPLPGIALSGENTTLGPEEATTWAAGSRRHVLDDQHPSFTYFEIEYENQVESYLSQPRDPFPGSGFRRHRHHPARHRGARPRAAAAGLGRDAGSGNLPGRQPSNVNLFVDGRSQNLGVSKTDGVDFLARYGFNTADMGGFTFTASGTYLIDHDVAITAVAPMVSRLNTIFNPLRFKARLARCGTWSPCSSAWPLRMLAAMTTTGCADRGSGYSHAAGPDIRLGHGIARLFVLRRHAAGARGAQCPGRRATLREHRAQRERQRRL